MVLSAKKETVSAATENGPSTKSTIDSVSAPATEVKPKAKDAYDLRELRRMVDISSREAVPVIQAIYPKFDKTMWSKVNSDQYGADLPEDARKALWERFVPMVLEARRRSRHGKHRLTCSIRARLPDDVYAALQQCIRAEGYVTMQDWVTEKVIGYLAEGGYIENDFDP